MTQIIQNIYIFAFAALISSAVLSCELNPDSKEKCAPGLLKMYPEVIKKWQSDSKGENSVLNASYWPENPKCINESAADSECHSLEEVLVSVTELPSPQASTRTYAASLIACSGISGASCRLYHRIYLITESTDKNGNSQYEMCSGITCQ